MYQDLRVSVDIDPRLPLLAQFQYVATCRAKLLETATGIVVRHELNRKA